MSLAIYSFFVREKNTSRFDSRVEKFMPVVARDCWIGVSEFLDSKSYRNLLCTGKEVYQYMVSGGDEHVWRILSFKYLVTRHLLLPSGSSWRDYFRTACFVSDKSQNNLSVALRLASSMGYNFIVNYILSNYAIDVNDASDTDQTGFTQSGSRAIHHACKSGRLDTAILLLSKFKASPDALDHNGRTALMLASAHGHYDVCECLIKYGCDVNISAHFGFTALHFASMMHYSSIVSLLLDNCAQVTIRDQRGWTPLMVAISSVPREKGGPSHIADRQVRVRQTLAQLLRNGANWSSPDCILTGKSVMDIAASLGLDEIASWMKEFVRNVPRGSSPKMLMPSVDCQSGTEMSNTRDVYYNL
jgi:hypothetical protein